MALRRPLALGSSVALAFVIAVLLRQGVALRDLQEDAVSNGATTRSNERHLLQSDSSPPRVRPPPSPPRVKSPPSPPRVKSPPSPPRVRSPPSPPRVRSPPSPPRVKSPPSPPRVRSPPSPKSPPPSPPAVSKRSPPLPPVVLPGYTTMKSRPNCPASISKCDQSQTTCALYRHATQTEATWKCGRLYSPDLSKYLEIDYMQAIMVKYAWPSEPLFQTYGYSQIGSIEDTDFGPDPTTLIITEEGRWIQVSSKDPSKVWTSSDNFGTSFPDYAGKANGPFTLDLDNSGELRILNKAGKTVWTSKDYNEIALCDDTKFVRWKKGTSDGQSRWAVCVCKGGKVNIMYWLDGDSPDSMCFDFPDPLILMTETNEIGSGYDMAIGLAEGDNGTAGTDVSQQPLDPRNENLEWILQEVRVSPYADAVDDFWLDSTEDYDTIVYYWLRLNDKNGLCATAYANVSAVSLEPCDHKNYGQHFLVERVTSQRIALQSRAEFTKINSVTFLPHCLGVADSDPSANATLVQTECDYGIAQRFRFYVPPATRRSALESPELAASLRIGEDDGDILPWERPDLDLEGLPEWKRDIVEGHRSGRLW
ncbi:hypothetical protein HYH03_007719 [Edaphochlamys debaryana]|uniref:Bulb-type lectin domain-containing protein n=1 Tax=Edaphochlamys debaryana TaxID=47281 RepID=A0A835Y2N0_9CHLO|nr:hypothetical protein HYH03_007719 [Edaphochlamys debaryana]|eukprot:KAG2494077.1 hypothetical protein HYH03_007719 [Edaphochlamys debaryana]